tara:strand:- start:4925 stop:5128 length:204 start_codon:yes stop_codon:yes gene_type:complete
LQGPIKNKFNVGELVAYNFKNILGAQEKVGLIIDIKSSPLYTWVYLVKWISGEQQVYAEQHLIAVTE